MSNLQGKIIITTGSAESSISLVSQLAQNGAQVFTFPMIDVQRAKISEVVSDAILHIHLYSWLLFTSKYGVKMFFETLHEITKSYNISTPIKIACVGKQTASVLQQFSYSADFISSKNNGKDFAQELSEFLPQPDAKILFPTGNLTQNMIPLTVPDYIDIHKIIVYETNPPQSYNPKISEKILRNQYDFIIFTSPSGVTNFVEVFRKKIDIRNLKVVSIGPSTTERLRSFRIQNILQTQEYNSQGIVQVILDFYKTNN